MNAYTDLEQPGEWVVDLATHRIVRSTPASCREGTKSPTLEAGPWAWRNTMSDDRPHEKPLDDLNPLEDIKGAIRYLKEIDPVEEVKEFMETAAEVLDPRRSDPRVVVPEADTESEILEGEIEKDERRPR